MKPRPTGGYSDTYDDAPVPVELGPPIETLEVGPDTVVIVRGESWDETNFAALRAALRSEVLLVHLPPGDTLEALDEAQMRAAGWVRVIP